MTPSTIELKADHTDHHVARMAAFAVGLSVAEAALPSPLPGVKPGLANIVTLLVLQRYGLKTAVWVSLLRVVASSLLLGGFLAPGFMLSLGGAIASVGMLALTRNISPAFFGPVTLSILAACAHIAGQLGVAYMWFIPHAGLFYLVPIFAATALLFGTVNGLIAARLIADHPGNTHHRSLQTSQH